MADLFNLRAFELSAGPATAKVLSMPSSSQLGVEKQSILSALNVRSSEVTFHTTKNKKVDTTPLPLNKPLDKIGLTDNGILIVRVKPDPEDKGRTLLAKGDDKDVPPQVSVEKKEELPPPEPATPEHYQSIIDTLKKELNASSVKYDKLAKEFEKEKSASAKRIEGLESSVKTLHHASDSACEDPKDPYDDPALLFRSRLGQYRCMTSALLAEWMNTHLVFAVAQNTVPAPFVHYMDIHEKILERFFDDVGQTNISAAELIEQSASVDSIYEALTIKYELKKTEKYTQVRHFLELFIPSFVSACPVICYICHEREAEFLEEMHLSLKCSSITPSTWLRIKRPDGSCAYFSTVSGFSQEHCPLVLKDLDCTTLEFPEKVECKRLSLCNAAQEQSKADTMFALRSELFGYSLCGSHHTDSVRNHMQSLITGFESFLAFSLFEDV